MSKEKCEIRLKYSRSINCSLSGSDCRVMDAYNLRGNAHNLIEAEMGCEDADLEITDKKPGISFVGRCLEIGKECGHLIVTAEPSR